jgi:hypothetical protein
MAKCPRPEPTAITSARPDPSLTGIRYCLTEHGCSFRESWPLSEAGIARLGQKELGCDGCTKLRPIYVGHRQRTGFWITVCMIHERVIGFHLISQGEGRRDAIIPIYRFKETAPSAMWYDFGCGVEESCLNWLPEYFIETQVFHDTFHGTSHKCCERFSSYRLPMFTSLNTSLMEQLNSFLQPLRGLLKAQTTKLSTMMFWMEVFVSEWNRRKIMKKGLSIK